MYYEGVIGPNARRLAVAAFSAVVLISASPAAAQNDLERARVFYNAGQFDESIAAATSASTKAAAANSAKLIIARARLERFRKLGDKDELATARADLMSLKPATLAPQESIEWQIGVATALFLEDQLGPASEMFTTLLPLARARLTITHAGLNTVLDSLANGVPMVAMPITYEQPAIARRLEWTGAGRSISLARLDSRHLGEVIRDVLEHARYRDSAGTIANAIQRAGGVARAADIVEAVLPR